MQLKCLVLLNMEMEKARIAYKTCSTDLSNIVTLDEIQSMSGISSSVATRRPVNPDRAT